MVKPIDQDGLNCFADNYSLSYSEIENIIISLGKSPTSIPLMDLLVQRLEFVNQGLIGDGLGIVVDVAIELVTLLNLTKGSSAEFESPISEIILVSIDHISDACHRILNKENINENVTVKLIETLRSINKQPKNLVNINTLDLFTFLSTVSQIKSRKKTQTKAKILPLRMLSCFKVLSIIFDAKYPSRKGRSQFLLQLCSEMNQSAKNEIDELQLTVAIYVHDFAMSLVFNNILNKSNALTETERKNLKSHPKYAAAFLDCLSDWSIARDIVLQHHERYDGSGYPAGLKKSEICDGAKILAIADSFFAMTQPSVYRKNQFTVEQAAIEINELEGKLYAPKWVMHFNTAIQQIYST